MASVIILSAVLLLRKHLLFNDIDLMIFMNIWEKFSHITLIFLEIIVKIKV